MTVRGTTNTNTRGSAESRRARRQWLLDTLGDGTHVKCHRCPKLLTVDTLSVDRIVPGCLGDTYARGNVRPACVRCNSLDGIALRELLRFLRAGVAPPDPEVLADLVHDLLDVQPADGSTLRLPAEALPVASVAYVRSGPVYRRGLVTRITPTRAVVTYVTPTSPTTLRNATVPRIALMVQPVSAGLEPCGC